MTHVDKWFLTIYMRLSEQNIYRNLRLKTQKVQYAFYVLRD